MLESNAPPVAAKLHDAQAQISKAQQTAGSSVVVIPDGHVD